MTSGNPEQPSQISFLVPCCLTMLNKLHAWHVVCILSHLRLQTFMSDELAHCTHAETLTTILMTQHSRLSTHDSTLSTQGSLQNSISPHHGACSEPTSSAGVGVSVPGAAGGAPGGVAEQQCHCSSRCQQQQRQLEWPCGSAAAAARLAHARCNI